uniref:BRO-N domain-containing protein n=1 Tax=Faecalibacterium sp. TaxID=1971605 RepID=UPI00402A0351
MTDILTFNNPEFGSIRSIEQNGEPWFVGKDVARSLGYGDGKSLANAVANHVDEQDKGVTELMTPGGTQKLVIINESGLYSLIFSSKLAGAQRFKRWVTSEVLPSIRKTGCYGTPDFAELSPELRCLIRLEQQQKQQAQELVRLNQKLDQLQGTGGFGTGGWRRESARIIAHIAQARGGAQYGPIVYQAVYTLLEEREHCSLTARLEALRNEQRQQGMSKTRAGRLTKMDAIAASPESVERWLKILHEMADRCGAATPEKE